MQPSRPIAILTTLLLAAACAATREAGPAPQHAGPAPEAPAPTLRNVPIDGLGRPSGIENFVVPAAGLHVTGGNERSATTLQQLVDEYAKRMGWSVLATRETRVQLQQLRCGLSADQDIPPERVHGFVESVLGANDFVLGFAHSEPPVVLRVESTQTPGHGNLRKDSCFVLPEELPRWSSHPAYLVTTVLRLPNVDVRTLSNSLRQMFADAQTQQIIPVGNSDCLIVTGFGADVASLTRLLVAVDESSAAERVTGISEAVAAAAGIQNGPAAQDLLRALPAADLHKLFPSDKREFAIDAPDGREAKLTDVLATFARRSGRELVVTPEARERLDAKQPPLASPRLIPAGSVYAFVSDELARRDCRLQPTPAAGPTTWIVDAASKRQKLEDVPFVRLDELARWTAFRATRFATSVRLPEALRAQDRDDLARQLLAAQDPCLVVPTGEGNVLGLCGTPQAILAAVGALFELQRVK